MKTIHKCYANGYPAVGGVSFGIKENQVMGLLGPNGAGKSTMFSMLTMEQARSFGEIQMLKTDIDHFDPKSHGNRMGLCAQQNLIWDKLTVDEHLQLLGALKGLSSADIQFQKELIKQTLDLKSFGDKQACQLSGGNKRKLCCAISLIGFPKCEFLDEPTTGVDPIARRSLFKMLKHLNNSSILLTTHRMDEAEALCDTIAIMINGRFVCLGSPGHLKQKYGQGYQIIARLFPNQNAEHVDGLIKTRLPFCERASV